MNRDSKIHFHTDCSFFAGCENMVAVLTNSKDLRMNYSLSLSYRSSETYSSQAENRFQKGISFHPLTLWVPELSKSFTQPKLKMVGATIRFVSFLAHNLICSIQNFVILLSTLLRIKPDILHINNGGFPGALSCRIAVLAGWAAGTKNILLVVNNMAVPYGNPYRRSEYFVDKFIKKRVKLFVTGSREASEKLRAVLDLREEETLSVPNGVQLRDTTESAESILRRFNTESNRLIFGVVGIMLPRKGHRLLFEAITKLLDNQEFLRASPVFLIEGTGEIREELIQLVSALKIEKFIKFSGVEVNIFNFYSVLDFLIYPSTVDEDFPNVISEALGMSIPVISSRVAGATQQIDDGINGILFEKGDSQALAHVILRVCQNVEKFSSMASRARTKYELYYTPETAVQRYMNIYEEMLGD
jgi:L-malate glycosyltransferase